MLKELVTSEPGQFTLHLEFQYSRLVCATLLGVDALFLVGSPKMMRIPAETLQVLILTRRQVPVLPTGDAAPLPL